MKNLIIVFVLLVLESSSSVFAQSVFYSRINDYSNAAVTNLGNDEGNEIIIADSNNYIMNVKLGVTQIVSGRIVYCTPNILITDSLFNVKDTIIIPDTSYQNKICYDKKSRNIWLASYNNYPTRLTLIKLDLEGNVLASMVYSGDTMGMVMPYAIFKTYPDAQGGLYLLAVRSTVSAGQNVDPWMICRFDSNGVIRWQKEYIFTYRYGKPWYMEKMPDGQLYVSGTSGREITAAIIDTATGILLSRNVIYRYPSNRAWFYGYAMRYPIGGYYVMASCQRATSDQDSSNARVYLDSNLVVQWKTFSRLKAYVPSVMQDSTIWTLRNDSSSSYSYEHYSIDGNLLHSIILSRDPGAAGDHIINDVAHFSNGSAAFIGTIDNSTYVPGALYFCKISQLGLPYNPTYPAYPPLPQRIDTLATQALSNEPALQLYPNPGNNTLHISHTGDLLMYNMQGQLVVQKSVQAGDVINTGSLPSGCYLARFRTRTAWLQAKWAKE